jgi:hypothetical protein
VLLIFFQNEAGQATGCKRRSINSNAIGTKLGRDRRRMTVHDQLAVLGLAGQERLTNVQKIIAPLAIESHAWPHAGVAEEIITDDR